MHLQCEQACMNVKHEWLKETMRFEFEFEFIYIP
jgi:hypothetical protein